MLMNIVMLKDQTGVITDQSIIHHLLETLKVQVGEELKCGLLNGDLCLGKVIEINAEVCKLSLGQFTKAQQPWFALIVGLSRPQTSKKIMEHATTFGAKKIHFYKAALSEKSYTTSKVFTKEESDELFLAGLSQSAIYTQRPELKIDQFNPAKEYADKKQKFILDLKATKSFLDYKDEIDFNQTIYLSIGPERGFISEDLNHFMEAGFKPVKISSTVLRVEHAVYSSIAQLEMLKGKY